MVGSMLPHDIRVVSHEPAVLHSAGGSEAQMHLDVVVQSAVVCRGIGAEWAILCVTLPCTTRPLYIREPLFSTFLVEARLTISYSPMFQSHP